MLFGRTEPVLLPPPPLPYPGSGLAGLRGGEAGYGAVTASRARRGRDNGPLNSEILKLFISFYFLLFTPVFKIKWPKSEGKINFGGDGFVPGLRAHPENAWYTPACRRAHV